MQGMGRMRIHRVVRHGRFRNCKRRKGAWITGGPPRRRWLSQGSEGSWSGETSTTLRWGGRPGRNEWYRAHTDSGAWCGGQVVGILGIALARLGQARRDASLEISDDLWRGVPIQGRVGCANERGVNKHRAYARGGDVHQVLASGSSMAGSTLRRLTLRMKP